MNVTLALVSWETKLISYHFSVDEFVIEYCNIECKYRVLYIYIEYIRGSMATLGNLGRQKIVGSNPDGGKQNIFKKYRSVHNIHEGLPQKNI